VKNEVKKRIWAEGWQPKGIEKRGTKAKPNLKVQESRSKKEEIKTNERT
jgi:hypothetical protein